MATDFYGNSAKKKDEETPVIFLGAEGVSNPKEVEFVKKKLKILRPRALFSRDSETFKIYSDFFDFSYDGIDCGFFINDWYQPPKTYKEFIVTVFDNLREPTINSIYEVIRLTHSPLGVPFAGFAREAYSTYNSIRIGLWKKKKVFFSDSLEDYLFFYANAKEVHSDRVHACVAATAYGVPAHYYGAPHRSKLFKKELGLENISKEPVAPDLNRLKEEKQKMILKLKKLDI